MPLPLALGRILTSRQRRMIRGSVSQMERDEDTAFVEGVMSNLNLGAVTEDVQDLAAEESEDEAASNTSDEEDFHDALQEFDAAPSKKKPLKSKKDRAIIEPPILKHIPLLVPIFIEQLRPSLIETREATRAATQARTG
jgi:hypothetical protein